MKRHKNMIFAVLGFLAIVGSYNAVIINSHSEMSDMKFVKRLDENLGVIVPGRSIAASMNWQKVTPQKMKPLKNPEERLPETPPRVADIEPSEATVKTDLNLQLVEVMNMTKWKQGLTQAQFSGSLESNDGVIESLSVSLPDGEGLNVAFSEMTGNVFQYQINGEEHSGMLYQVDQTSYMVTLTSGPLEGTKMRFSGSDPELAQQETSEQLAQNDVAVQTFGQEQTSALEPEQMIQDEQAPAQETAQNQGFNFGSQSM